MRSLLSPDEDDSTPLFCWWRSAPEFEDDARALKVAAGVPNLGPRARVLREMERLALVAPESLDDLRHKLLSYRPADFWFPAGGIKKEDFDIPPLITILLVGFSGSGKSSLVNLMYSVLGRAGLIPFAQTSSGKRNRDLSMPESHPLGLRLGLNPPSFPQFCREFVQQRDHVSGRAQCVEVAAKWVLRVRFEGSGLRPGERESGGGWGLDEEGSPPPPTVLEVGRSGLGGAVGVPLFQVLKAAGELRAGGCRRRRDLQGVAGRRFEAIGGDKGAVLLA